MSVRQRRWQHKGEHKAVWVCDFRGPDGKRHLRTFTKRADAETYHALAAVVRIDHDLMDDPVIGALALRLVRAIVEIGKQRQAKDAAE